MFFELAVAGHFVELAVFGAPEPPEFSPRKVIVDYEHNDGSMG